MPAIEGRELECCTDTWRLAQAGGGPSLESGRAPLLYVHVVSAGVRCGGMHRTGGRLCRHAWRRPLAEVPSGDSCMWQITRRYCPSWTATRGRAPLPVPQRRPVQGYRSGNSLTCTHFYRISSLPYLDYGARRLTWFGSSFHSSPPPYHGMQVCPQLARSHLLPSFGLPPLPYPRTIACLTDPQTPSTDRSCG